MEREINLDWLTYLGACHVHGWTVSEKGYQAFKDQIEKGLRNTNGILHYED